MIAASALFLAISPAAAEKRLALVIGQSAYRSVVALPNPSNDARKMTEMLGSAGFDVTATADLTQNDLRQAVGDFAAKVAASGADTVALMFYAGHGDTQQAETLLRQAAAQPGASMTVRQNLALVLGLQGRLAEAERIVRQDLPPEVVANNMAYLRAAAANGSAVNGRSWENLRSAQ